jgi:hypothetical protein
MKKLASVENDFKNLIHPSWKSEKIYTTAIA